MLWEKAYQPPKYEPSESEVLSEKLPGKTVQKITLVEFYLVVASVIVTLALGWQKGEPLFSTLVVMIGSALLIGVVVLTVAKWPAVAASIWYLLFSVLLGLSSVSSWQFFVLLVICATLLGAVWAATNRWAPTRVMAGLFCANAFLGIALHTYLNLVMRPGIERWWEQTFTGS
jgi:hypothetical protein